MKPVTQTAVSATKTGTVRRAQRVTGVMTATRCVAQVVPIRGVIFQQGNVLVVSMAPGDLSVTLGALANIASHVTLTREFVTTVKQVTGVTAATKTVPPSASTNVTATPETVSRALPVSGATIVIHPVSVKIVRSVHGLPDPVQNVIPVTMVTIAKSFVSQRHVRNATKD